MDKKKGSVLEFFTTDLTKKAGSGLIDPVVGRRQEIERLVSILNRRTKNNPIFSFYCEIVEYQFPYLKEFDVQFDQIMI